VHVPIVPLPRLQPFNPLRFTPHLVIELTFTATLSTRFTIDEGESEGEIRFGVVYRFDDRIEM
jgi:hypothetical protein